MAAVGPKRSNQLPKAAKSWQIFACEPFRKKLTYPARFNDVENLG